MHSYQLQHPCEELVRERIGVRLHFLCDQSSIEEAIGGRFPAQGMSLFRGQRVGIVMQCPDDIRSKLLWRQYSLVNSFTYKRNVLYLHCDK